jgi:hypothetical protein
MKRLIAIALFLSSPAQADFMLLGSGNDTDYVAPAEVRFSQNFRATSALDGKFTFYRGDTSQIATYVNSSGNLALASPAGAARFDYSFTSPGTPLGLLIEESRTQDVINNRNLNAWPGKSNVSAALSQTGVTGVANSATLLTSVANNGTIGMSAVSGTPSGTRVMTAYIKRGTGSGNIRITQNGYSTSTSTAATSSWVRYLRPSSGGESVTSLSVGLNLLTTANTFAVDMVQSEICPDASNCYPTSAIVNNTSGRVTRASDQLGASASLSDMLSEGWSLVEKMDEATGTITRTAYAPNTLIFPAGYWYRLVCVFDPTVSGSTVQGYAAASSGTGCTGEAL